MHAFFASSCGGTRFEAAQWRGAGERQHSGAAHGSGAGFEAAQWRGEVISIPGRGWQPCVAPYFATRGRGDMRGTKSPNQIAPRRWCVAVQPPRPGCWAAPRGGVAPCGGPGLRIYQGLRAEGTPLVASTPIPHNHFIAIIDFFEK